MPKEQSRGTDPALLDALCRCPPDLLKTAIETLPANSRLGKMRDFIGRFVHDIGNRLTYPHGYSNLIPESEGIYPPLDKELAEESLRLTYFLIDHRGQILSASNLKELCQELAPNEELPTEGLTTEGIIELTIQKLRSNLESRATFLNEYFAKNPAESNGIDNLRTHVTTGLQKVVKTAESFYEEFISPPLVGNLSKFRTFVIPCLTRNLYK